VGTGGGFPGIPLAILFPETRFYLIDVILKKINVVKAVAESLGLKNVKAEQLRAELVKGDFDFIVSRAVTNMPDFVSWIKDKTKKQSKHELRNGILYLKGGDLTQNSRISPSHRVQYLRVFQNEFFETKKWCICRSSLKHRGTTTSLKRKDRCAEREKKSDVLRKDRFLSSSAQRSFNEMVLSLLAQRSFGETVFSRKAQRSNFAPTFGSNYLRGF
jgi:16S rRNA (guanine(527)-N(7))-methyltransferase RsmG